MSYNDEEIQDDEQDLEGGLDLSADDFDDTLLDDDLAGGLIADDDVADEFTSDDDGMY